jgi:hypothetical protein
MAGSPQACLSEVVAGGPAGRVLEQQVGRAVQGGAPQVPLRVLVVRRRALRPAPELVVPPLVVVLLGERLPQGAVAVGVVVLLSTCPSPGKLSRM